MLNLSRYPFFSQPPLANYKEWRVLSALASELYSARNALSDADSTDDIMRGMRLADCAEALYRAGDIAMRCVEFIDVTTTARRDDWSTIQQLQASYRDARHSRAHVGDRVRDSLKNGSVLMRYGRSGSVETDPPHLHHGHEVGGAYPPTMRDEVQRAMEALHRLGGTTSAAESS